MILQRGNPFYYRGGDVGCLLVHGLTGAPEEMRWMGQYLANAGYTVLGLRLFAHATHPNDLTRARWQDWWACVEDGYHLLRGTCEKIFVMGLSLGGALSLAMGSSLKVEGLVAMSTPYLVPDSRVARWRPLIPLVSRFWRFAKPPGPSDWRNHEVEKKNLDYGIHSLRAVAELHDLLSLMRNNLARLEAPVLLIQSKGDGLVPQEHAKMIYKQLGSPDKDLFWIEGSGHNLPRDAAREIVFAAAAAFVQRVMGAER
jgi:carboxylesterase